MSNDLEETPSSKMIDKDTATDAQNNHGDISRSGNGTRARKGRGQPRFYPVTKDEPNGQFTKDMLRKVDLC